MQEVATVATGPEPQMTGGPPRRSKAENRIRALFNQENIATMVVALIIGIAVILPLIALFINSFWFWTTLVGILSGVSIITY